MGLREKWTSEIREGARQVGTGRAARYHSRVYPARFPDPAASNGGGVPGAGHRFDNLLEYGPPNTRVVRGLQAVRRKSLLEDIGLLLEAFGRGWRQNRRYGKAWGVVAGLMGLLIITAAYLSPWVMLGCAIGIVLEVTLMYLALDYLEER